MGKDSAGKRGAKANACLMKRSVEGKKQLKRQKQAERDRQNAVDKQIAAGKKDLAARQEQNAARAAARRAGGAHPGATAAEAEAPRPPATKREPLPELEEEQWAELQSWLGGELEGKLGSDEQAGAAAVLANYLVAQIRGTKNWAESVGNGLKLLAPPELLEPAALDSLTAAIAAKAGCGVSGEGDVAGDAPRLRADAVIGAAGGGSGGGKVGKSGGEKRSVKRPATAASAAGGSGGGQKDGVVVVRQKKKKRKKARITVEEDGR